MSLKIKGEWGDIFIIPDNRIVENIKITKKDGKIFYLSIKDMQLVCEIDKLNEDSKKINLKLIQYKNSII